MIELTLPTMTCRTLREDRHRDGQAHRRRRPQVTIDLPSHAVRIGLVAAGRAVRAALVEEGYEPA
ncbi:MAG: copper chaperone [Comamonadaceae bacterium]|nr:copper chaperone [Comamonadaceae bacterium]